MLRIYKKLQYIVYHPEEVEGMNASVLTGEQMHRWLKDGSMKDKDEIYAVRLVAVAVEKREITLERR